MLPQPAAAVGDDREQKLTVLAHRLVDAVCQGNLGEVAFVVSYALVSVLRSWPHRTGREVLTKTGRRLARNVVGILRRMRHAGRGGLPGKA